MRARIPITIASLGPKSVEQTAEIADGWLPMFFHPERAAEVWGDALAAGAAKRADDLAPLDVFASPALAITDHPEAVLPLVKPQLALYVGGMGARGKNFYNDLISSYGFEAEAALHPGPLPRRTRDEAIAAVPDELVRAVSLIGPASYVAERVAAFRAAGVTTLAVTPLARSSAERIALMSGFRALVG